MSELELTSADRCDQCQAQAWTHVWLRTGELFLCGHHFAKHEARLRDLDAMWIDDRSKINATLDVGPA